MTALYNWQPTKRLSFVVVTWNEKDDLAKCLASLAKVVDPDRDEIIVIDNDSRDGTGAMVEADYPRVLYCKMPENIGPGPARNRGIWLAQGEYIVFLDNDTIVPPGPLGDLVVEIFASNRDIGLLAFALEYMDGRPQRNYRRFPTIITPLATRIPLMRKLPYLRRQHELASMDDITVPRDREVIMDVDWVLGANQIIRKSTAVLLNGFDEHMRYAVEDLDLCLRVWRMGLRVCLANHVSIKHKYRRRGTRPGRLMVREIRGFLYLFRREKSLWKLSPSRL